MSVVFDARKHAEKSKRARETRVDVSPSPGSPMPSAEVGPALAGNSSSVVSVATTTPLGFAVERHTADWRVSWRPNSAIGAVRGRLSIHDGSIHKHVDLSAGELQSGSMVYSPANGDVLFRLEVVGAATETPVSESVHVLGPSLSSGQRAENAAIHHISKNAHRGARANAVWAPPTGSVAQSSPFVRSLLRLPRANSNHGISAAPPFSPAAGMVEPATAIARSEPIYPANAKERLISGTVELHYRISPEGKVYDVTILKGSPVLARAAIDAVQSWRYNPARLNGVPVESEASTNFDFRLN